MKLWLNAVRYPVTSLGPGRRLGIWFQGCDLACPGCMSRDTWNSESGTETTVDRLLGDLADGSLLSGETPQGITISGGEPLQQPEALRLLVRRLRQRWPDTDVLLYTGLRASLLPSFKAALADVDAVVAGPYVESRGGGGHWRGSANQQLIILSQRGATRISEWACSGVSSTLQMFVEDEALVVIGIPEPGDLDRLTAALDAAANPQPSRHNKLEVR